MSTLAVNAITNAAGGNTATINGMTPTADSLQGFRNRLINSDMRIDQRNNGASVTINSGTAVAYPVDRFSGTYSSASGAMTLQRSTDVPAGQGFTNSVVATVTTANASLGATETVRWEQRVEGFNFADLDFGTSGAKPVTLSFWVKSSLTGTFGGSLRNSGSGGNRVYVFSYSISAANTWEQKTVTITGDTTGTWETGNGVGAVVEWSLGAGADRVGSAGSWGSSFLLGVTGQAQVIGTLSATWQITGVQLEAGSVATPFERRPYTTEEQLCFRYFWKGRVVGFGIASWSVYDGVFAVPLPVVMRATPTVTTLTSMSNSAATITGATATAGPSTGAASTAYPNLITYLVQNSAGANSVGNIRADGVGTAAAEL